MNLGCLLDNSILTVWNFLILTPELWSCGFSGEAVVWRGLCCIGLSAGTLLDSMEVRRWDYTGMVVRLWWCGGETMEVWWWDYGSVTVWLLWCSGGTVKRWGQEGHWVMKCGFVEWVIVREHIWAPKFFSFPLNCVLYPSYALSH